ncbi:MAG: hypothetical protein ABFD46_01200 [Armatimonadota bacterium]
MMRRTRILIYIAVMCLSAVIPTYAQTMSVKYASNGEFNASDKSIHRWKVDGAHTLIWDGQPYIPVGGVFYSSYICISQTEENWQADIKSLETIKASGITDLLLKAIGPATWTKPAAWQRLMDYLDANGFSYGIDLADGPKPPLNGYVIEPAKYRVADITKDTTFTFNMPDVVSALWMLCSADDGAVLASGGASVSGGKVRVDIKGRSDQSCVLLLYPEKEFSNGGQPGVEDIWSGFDEFRDRLLAFVSGLKFGKGFRFFVDPLTSKMDFIGELDNIVPDSSDYRLEFEAYLSKKYQTIGSLNTAWGLIGANMTSFQEAARMMPLWQGMRGVPEIFDRAKGQCYKIDTPRSRVWDDIHGFRDSSTQNYLNTAADLLKKHAADVPVIYRASRMHRIFANSRPRGGFDGLGVDCYGHGQNLVINTAGPVYSSAEESVCSMWFVVTSTMDTAAKEKASPGYESRDAMFADLDSLGEIGVKGLFVNGLQILPGDIWKNHSLVLIPEQLGWLKEFKDKFQGGQRAAFAPYVIYYPSVPVMGAETKRLGPGKWWLPSLRYGTGYKFGDMLAGYTIPSQDGVCLFSRVGNTTATFPLQKEQKPAIVFPQDQSGILTFNKKGFTVTLGDTPVLISGLEERQMFPLEVVDKEMAKLGPLVARAKATDSRVPDAETATNRAKGVLKNGLPAVAYDIVHTFVEQIGVEIGTYSWIEGENTVSNSFNRVVPSLRASNGAYLSLDTKLPPPMSPYTASYVVGITKDALHDVWIAASGVEAGSAAISFSFDNEPWQQAACSVQGVSSPGFHWVRIGSVDLMKGTHMIQIRLDSPDSTGNYKLDLDAIVICPGEFRPDGIVKP